MWAGLREGQCHQPPAWGLGALCVLWKRLRGSPHESDSEKLPAGPRPHSAPSTPAAECPPAGSSPFPSPLPLWPCWAAPEAGHLLGHPGTVTADAWRSEWHRPRGCSVGGRLLQRWSFSTRRALLLPSTDKAGAGPHNGCRLHKVDGPMSETALQGRTGPTAQEVASLQNITRTQRSPWTHPGRALPEEIVATRNKHPTSSSALWGVQDRTPIFGDRAPLPVLHSLHAP